MALTELKKDALKLILFGGKGGVGKTTCAAGTGFYLSRKFKTLLISTDPAHSLSDSLGQRIGDPDSKSEEISGVAVKGMNNLSALEINVEKALRRFKRTHEEEIKQILSTSTYLDQEDIEAVLTLPIPGIDEVMSFKMIMDLVEEGRFDKYIVDTAPTGHALRLITLPGLLDEWIKVTAKMRWKYRYMVKTFSGDYQPDEGDDFLMEMKKTVKRMETLLKDPQRCVFVAVTIPEAMAVNETERLIQNLRAYGMTVKHLVVNNILDADRCDFCREKRKEQGEYLRLIRKKFSQLKMTLMPLKAREVRGMERLKDFASGLFPD